MLFYSIRPSAGPATPLSGASVDDGLPIQTGDEELLGQVDGVESGEVTGWACLRGYLARPLQVCSKASLLTLFQLQPPYATSNYQACGACTGALLELKRLIAKQLVGLASR